MNQLHGLGAYRHIIRAGDVDATKIHTQRIKELANHPDLDLGEAVKVTISAEAKAMSMSETAKGSESKS